MQTTFNTTCRPLGTARKPRPLGGSKARPPIGRRTSAARGERSDSQQWYFAARGLYSGWTANWEREHVSEVGSQEWRPAGSRARLAICAPPDAER